MREYNIVTLNDVRNNEEINTYIKVADEALKQIGYTEHSFSHVSKVADTAGYILETLGYSKREVELAKIAGYMHDIGNLVNRVNHAFNGSVMAFKILKDMNMDPFEIATISTAIGNHDESASEPVNAICASLILADKTDVRRSRVRNTIDPNNFDIHDRVNYSVTKTQVKINEEKTLIKLKMNIDIHYCSVMDYFEIFLTRMKLCKKAANKLGLEFKLIINEQQLL